MNIEDKSLKKELIYFKEDILKDLRLEMYKLINKIEIQKYNEEIRFYFEAKSFLHNMIRIIVGVLLEVGRKKITNKDVENILKNQKRPDKCETAPACGLYFLETIY